MRLLRPELTQDSSYFQGDSSEVTRPEGLQDKHIYAFIVGGVGIFFFMTYPYRDISVPSEVLGLFGLMVLLSLIVSSWLRPQYYLASIAFCIYAPFSAEYPGDFGRDILGMNFTNILVVPLLLQWLMQRTLLGERWFHFHAPDMPLLLFMLLSGLSLFRGAIAYGDVYFQGTAIELYRWLLPMALYFIFANMARNERGVKHIVVTICIAIVAIAILAMKESYDIGPGGTWDRQRIKGVLKQPNATGAFFVYYTLIFLGFFLCNWRSRRAWWLVIPFLICGRAMTLANSRGGLIAFALAILGIFFVRSKILFLFGLGAVVYFSYFPQYLPETISGRLMTTVRAEPEPGEYENPVDVQHVPIVRRLDRSAQGRVRIWAAGIKLVKQRPWIGHGYREFPRRIGAIDPNVAGRDPHNTYLGIAAEMGLVAMVAFILTLLLILKSCLHVYHHAPDMFMQSVGLAGVGMCMGVLSANFFGSRMETMELTAYFWILSAVIVQYSRELRLRQRLQEGYYESILVDPWEEEAEEEEEEEEY